MTSVAAAADAPPASFDSGNKAKGQLAEPELISLPEDFRFSDSDVQAALKRGLTQDDVQTALESFRSATESEVRPLAKWKSGARAWLRIQKPVEENGPTGTRLTDDFVVLPELVERIKRLTKLEQNEVWEANNAFRAYYKAATGRKAFSSNWQESWDLWMMREAKKANEKKGKGPGGAKMAV